MKISVILIYCVLLCILFFGLPKEIIHGQGFIRWVPFIFIFFIQTFLLYKILSSFNINSNTKQLIVAISVLIFGPSFGFYLKAKTEQDLKKYGVKTKGIVHKKWFSSGKNSGWLVRCNYIVNGQTFSTFSENDKLNKYKIGDTLTVLYNSEFPQECNILELN